MPSVNQYQSFVLANETTLKQSCEEAKSLSEAELHACVSIWKYISNAPDFLDLFKQSSYWQDVEKQIAKAPAQIENAMESSDTGQQIAIFAITDGGKGLEKLKFTMGIGNAFRKLYLTNGSEPSDEDKVGKTLYALFKEKGISDPDRIKACGSVFNQVIFIEQDHLCGFLAEGKPGFSMASGIAVINEDGQQKAKVVFRLRDSYYLKPEEVVWLHQQYRLRGFNFKETALGQTIGPVTSIYERRGGFDDTAYIVAKPKQLFSTNEITVLNNEHLVGRQPVVGEEIARFTTGIADERQRLLQNLDGHLQVLVHWRDILSPLLAFKKEVFDTLESINASIETITNQRKTMDSQSSFDTDNAEAIRAFLRSDAELHLHTGRLVDQHLSEFRKKIDETIIDHKLEITSQEKRMNDALTVLEQSSLANKALNVLRTQAAEYQEIEESFAQSVLVAEQWIEVHGRINELKVERDRYSKKIIEQLEVEIFTSQSQLKTQIHEKLAEAKTSNEAQTKRFKEMGKCLTQPLPLSYVSLHRQLMAQATKLGNVEIQLNAAEVSLNDLKIIEEELEKLKEQRNSTIKAALEKIEQAALVAVEKKLTQHVQQLADLQPRLRDVSNSSVLWQNLQDDSGIKSLVGSIQQVFDNQVDTSRKIESILSSNNAMKRLAEVNKILDFEKQRRENIVQKLQHVEHTMQCLQKQASQRSRLHALQNKLKNLNGLNEIFPRFQSDDSIQKLLNTLQDVLHKQKIYLNRQMTLDPTSEHFLTQLALVNQTIDELGRQQHDEVIPALQRLEEKTRLMMEQERRAIAGKWEQLPKLVGELRNELSLVAQKTDNLHKEIKNQEAMAKAAHKRRTERAQRRRFRREIEEEKPFTTITPLILDISGNVPHPSNVNLAKLCQEMNLPGRPAPIGQKRRGIYMDRLPNGSIRMVEWDKETNTVSRPYVITVSRLNDLIEKLQQQGRTLNDLRIGEVISFTPVIDIKNTIATQKTIGKVANAFKKGFKR